MDTMLSLIPDECLYFVGIEYDPSPELKPENWAVYCFVDSTGMKHKYRHEYVLHNYGKMRICNAVFHDGTLAKIDTNEKGLSTKYVIDQYKMYVKALTLDVAVQADESGKISKTDYNDHRIITEFNNVFNESVVRIKDLEVVSMNLKVASFTKYSKVVSSNITLHYMGAAIWLLNMAKIECDNFEILEECNIGHISDIIRSLDYKIVSIKRIKVNYSGTHKEAAELFSRICISPMDQAEKECVNVSDIPSMAKALDKVVVRSLLIAKLLPDFKEACLQVLEICRGQLEDIYTFSDRHKTLVGNLGIWNNSVKVPCKYCKELMELIDKELQHSGDWTTVVC